MSGDDEIVVDARGHRCPVPTLRLRRAVEQAPAGSIVRLLADDPLARIDAPHFARAAGLEVLEVSADSGLVTVKVRKPEGARRAGGTARRQEGS